MPALKLIISFFLIFFGLVTSSPVSAEITFSDVTKDKWTAPVHATYTLDNTLCGIIDLMTWACPFSEEKPVYELSSSGKVQLVMAKGLPVGGAIGTLTNTMIALYTPPTSTVNYLASIGKNFGLASPVYAKTTSVPGSGAGIIEPVRVLWQVIRNLVYLVFIVVFLVVGLMIMFRQKVSQQAVIGIQQALPGLIIGLILVTFSYFISALIIDTAFIGTRLVGEIFISTNQPNWFGEWDKNRPNFTQENTERIQNMVNQSSIFDLFMSAMWSAPNNIGDIFGGTLNTITSNNTIRVLSGIVMAVIGGIIGSFFAPVAGTVAGTAAGFAAGYGGGTAVLSLLIPVVLIIILFIQLFRLLFELISSYIQILIGTIIGPLIILTSSIPGKSGNLSSWWKGLLGNALVFPAVFAAFLFAGLIMSTPIDSWSTTPPLFGGLETKLIKVILAYGILMGTPGIPKAVRNAFNIKGDNVITQTAQQAIPEGIRGTKAIFKIGRGAVKLIKGI